MTYKTHTRLSLTDQVVITSLGVGAFLTLAAFGPLTARAALYLGLIYGLAIWLYARLPSPLNKPLADGVLQRSLPGGAAQSRPTEPHILAQSRAQNPTQSELEYAGEARLANSLHEAVIIIDAKENIVFINDQAQSLFPKIQIGHSFTSLLRSPKILNLIRRAAQQLGDAQLITLHTPVERHFKVTATPLDTDMVDALDHSPHIVVVLYDVTDMERANTMRADFLANASHELKTPIASLLGYIETLNGHARDDAAARTKFLAIMQSQAERMQRLIDDLLSLRRIELTEHIAPTDKADFFQAAQSVIETLTPLAQSRNVKLEYSGETNLTVRGNPDELVQLILNIVDNAIQMSQPDQTIYLRGEKVKNWQSTDDFAAKPLHDKGVKRRILNPPEIGGDYAVLRIRDAGPGFAKEHLPRLCERFYRIAGDRKGQNRGTGLGLAIVKHITLRHRGGLMVESAQGIGTEFSLIIPLASSDKAISDTHTLDRNVEPQT